MMIGAEAAPKTIVDRLNAGEFIISDGATGTWLQSKGLEPGGCPEELNATRPGLIRQMAREYFDAGSDMVLTASFGGSRFMLDKYGHGARVRELNRLAAEHARSQAPPGGLIAGSVGPTGEFIEPLGSVSQAEMLDAFAEQITALEEGGADAVVIETMFALDETRLAVRAARENTSLAVIATMTFDKGPRGFFTMMGVTPQEAAQELPRGGRRRGRGELRQRYREHAGACAPDSRFHRRPYAHTLQCRDSCNPTGPDSLP